MFLDPHYLVDREREDDGAGMSESSTSSSHFSRASTRPSPLTPDSPTLPTPASGDFLSMQTFAAVHGLVVSLGEAQRERQGEELKLTDVMAAQRSYAAEARERVRERSAGSQKLLDLNANEGENADDVDMDMFEEALLARRAREDPAGIGLEHGSSFVYGTNEMRAQDKRITLSASPPPPLSPSTHAFGALHEQRISSGPGHVAFLNSPKDDQMDHEARYDRSEKREARTRSQQGLAAAGFLVNEPRQRSPRVHSAIQAGLSPTRSKFANAPPSPFSLSFTASTDTSSQQSLPKHHLHVQVNQTKTHAYAQDQGPPSPLPFTNFTTRALDPRDKTPTPVTTTITVEKASSGGSLFSKFRKRAANDTVRSPTPTAASAGSTPLSLTFSGTSSGSGSVPASATQPGFNLTPTPSNFNSDALVYPPTRPLSPKSAKAEAKRRKKEEEKARLEALALQFKQGRQKNAAMGDMASVAGAASIMSGSSGERRRLANEWVEESKCMYGGIGASWGGL